MFTYKVNTQISLGLLQPHHAGDVYSLVESNREHLKEWLGWVNHIKSKDDYSETIIPLWLKQFADHNGFNSGIFYEGKLVGMVSLHFINWKTKHTSVGYYLSKQYEGKGIISLCIKSICEHAFCDLGLNKVEVQCAEANSRSRNVPERLGFKQEGINRDAEFINGHYNNIVTYSMLRKEWLENQ
ncbi:GNAT family N-acetyltransferase [Jeotgalibacillus terrae]|uniref:GNAT family N-acetyltransferase n=1 Tax=Jeotgalibacillus terrae TaxID=587735 RepID=A0ABW5ZKD9_9BACL|nr:GNAT family protein [Jeotgalibacillus terrae]MBM7578153.1 ribosomal-protein-serine acetyltransferase [Jeotgalibacillus terrae]